MTTCPRQAKPFMSFHVLVFYFCISRQYDVSKKSCLGLPDMKCLRMYYREIWLVVNFSLPKVIYCEPLLFLLLAYITSLSKISLYPRFLKPSLKIEARGSSIRRLAVGDARTNWLSSLVVGKWVPHNRKSAAIKSAIATLGPWEGWIVRSYISWRGERSTPYKGVETSPRRILKSWSWRQYVTSQREQYLLAVGLGLGCYKMVWELDTGLCASEDVGPPRGVDYEIPHRLERGTKHPL